MPRLNYVGPSPSDDGDLANRGQSATVLNDTPASRPAVSSLVTAQVGVRASKNFIDTADAAFATASYYTSRDALNVATSAVGAKGGVASLVSGKIPSAQVPVLGDGYLKGPFGPTTITATTGATTTPVKIAEFAIGVQNLAFHPLGYALVAVDSTPGGRPLIEMRIANGTTGTQTVFAQGIGRTTYRGRQIVAVTPCVTALGAANPAPFPVNTNIVVTMWISSTTATPVVVASSSVLSAAVFLSRMSA